MQLTTMDKINKLKSADTHHKKLQLIYQWAKTGHINFVEFKYMIDMIKES